MVQTNDTKKFQYFFRDKNEVLSVINRVVEKAIIFSSPYKNIIPNGYLLKDIKRELN
jgi:hypothetical protein